MAISHERRGFFAALGRLTGRREADIVFGHASALTFQRSVAALAIGGRLATCGATSGRKAHLDIDMLFRKRLPLLGSIVGSKAAFLDTVRLVGEGKLSPVLARAPPPQEAARGDALLADCAQLGKVVLVP